MEGHAPLTWEQIVELPITSNADPESDAEAGGAPASDQERLDNLESAVDLLCRGWERLAEDMRQLRQHLSTRLQSDRGWQRPVHDGAAQEEAPHPRGGAGRWMWCGWGGAGGWG